MSSNASINGPAVSVRDVGKCYQIYDRPQDRLKQALLRWRGKKLYREFWALRHVNLELNRGECVGIIGRNGSGKSTLLQMIAGTLRWSEGQIETSGRVAAILELGSGFNSEFTGRENVFINAAILGISAEEIESRYQEIVDFAEIGQFINQPIKTYSSGMIVRLAFAVQALLDPDVLIVDEALAVGDEAFQRKCYGWLERFRAQGGTVLFVTHSAQLVVQVCDRAILLEHGQMIAHGPSKPVVDVYQKLLYGTVRQGDLLRHQLSEAGGRADLVQVSTETSTPEASESPEPQTDPAFYDEQMIRPPEITYGTGDAEIHDFGMFDRAGRRINVLTSGQRCTWRYKVRFAIDAVGVNFGMMIKTKEGLDVVGISSGVIDQRLDSVKPGQVVQVQFDMVLNLTPGTYFLNSGVSAMISGEDKYLHRRIDVAAVRVTAPDDNGLYGIAYVQPQFKVEFCQPSALSYA